jgi:hypothetical protein
VSLGTFRFNGAPAGTVSVTFVARQ